ncbi:MAG: universal stress protein [Syntrophobacteraceae bacterium]|nr:universal stress protein [Syntrophobacteraceae bacterium]
MFRRILLPTKFDEFSPPVLGNLACMKAAGLKEVVLLHVIDTERFYQDAGIPLNRDSLHTAAARNLIPYCEFLQSEGIYVTTEIRKGHAAATIVDTAVEKAVSLIVVAEQKRNVLEDLYTGPVTNRVVRKAKVPVLITKHHTRHETNGQICDRHNTQVFNKVLYPSGDWSSHAIRAKEFFHDLQKLGASEVVLVYVMEDFRDCVDVPAPFGEAATKELESKARAEIENLGRDLQSSGFLVKGHLVQGEPYAEIMRIASEENASLIVMDSQGKGFVKAILWGSVSQKVVENSEIPVLVVKHEAVGLGKRNGAGGNSAGDIVQEACMLDTPKRNVELKEAISGPRFMLEATTIAGQEQYLNDDQEIDPRLVVHLANICLQVSLFAALLLALAFFSF